MKLSKYNITLWPRWIDRKIELVIIYGLLLLLFVSVIHWGRTEKGLILFITTLPAFVVMGLSLLIIHFETKALRYYYTIIALDRSNIFIVTVALYNYTIVTYNYYWFYFLEENSIAEYFIKNSNYSFCTFIIGSSFTNYFINFFEF
mgnify:CR=1 FL=1